MILPVISMMLFWVSGCTSYRVRVNGYLNLPQGKSLAPNSAICVIENEEANNPIFEKEIRKKIEYLLSNAGYSLRDFESADYYLMISYGISDGKTKTGAVPIYNPGQSMTINTYGTSGSSYSTAQTPGYTTYMPVSTTVFTRYLQLHLIDAAHYRVNSEVVEVWVGDTISTGENSDLREVINYLLISAFEYFGQDTKKGKRKEIYESDERAKALMAI